tara:strand:+ start:136 stop:606 length:471 start_codon:yes stop_codon:yes gene_type:complete
MKHLSLLLFTSLSLSLAQDLTLKKNNKTVTIKQNQPVVIVTQSSEVFNGRFQKIGDNSIILEGNNIAIDQLKEIKLMHTSLYGGLRSFVKGGLIYGGLTVVSVVVIGVAIPSAGQTASLFLIVSTPFSAFLGGSIYAYRYFAPYKIDQDNWKIVAG